MNVSIFGLGYVGCVSAACLANDGNNVVGVDINVSKVNLINNGLPTIVEKDIDLLLKQGWESRKIRATNDHKTALRDSDVSIICVGTPSNKSGHLNINRVRELQNI